MREGMAMADKPKHPCAVNNCPELVPAGQRYCEKHRDRQREVRPGASGRGYGYKWQKASRRFLEEHPLCVRCMERGVYTKAEVVDHIVPHRGDMKLFWDRTNWQPLCKRCHDRKTATEDMEHEYRF